MPVVKINAIEVPPDAGPELEKRFANRAHAVDNQPGFLGFQLLRPVKGEDRYFVVTQWESEEAFQAWATRPSGRGTRRSARESGGHGRVATGVRGRTGRCGRQGVARGRSRHGAVGVAIALVVALACGCAHTGPASPADAAYGVPIAINTPQGLRAKQTMDMLNSDWPIGTVGVRTMAAPRRSTPVTSAMGNLWWDRPITVRSIDIGAGSATLHVLTSYGAKQDIELRTNDAGLVDRFEVTMQPPVIKKWSDIDAELTASGARYSYQVSKVSSGKCETLAGTNTDAVVAVGVDLQTLCAACGCAGGQCRHGELERPS